MTSEHGKTTQKTYRIRYTSTPLSGKNTESQKRDANKITAPTQPVRAINEDDDGYDPYSDLKEQPTFFEKDPWR